MKNFSDFVSDLDLVDLGSKGAKFTWDNIRKGEYNVKERLDMDMTNLDWLDLFPKATLHIVPTTKSDHFALLMNMVGSVNRSKRPFRFHNMWTYNPTCRDVNANSWGTFQESPS